VLGCARVSPRSTGNISAAPQFVYAGDYGLTHSNGDYHLSPGSPCIDTGRTNSMPVVDVEGRVRPADGPVDMGAWEFLFLPKGVIMVIR